MWIQTDVRRETDIMGKGKGRGTEALYRPYGPYRGS